MLVEVPISILLEKLQKLLADERVIHSGLTNDVATAVNKLKQILSFLQAPNEGRITENLKELLNSVYSADNITERVLLNKVQRRRKGVVKTELWQEFVNGFAAVASIISQGGHDLANNTVCIGEVSLLEVLQYDQELDVLTGREAAEIKLKDRLINDEKSFCVISLVSEHPVGKTALARTVYNRQDICRHFQRRAWVHIPKDLEYKDLLLIILRAIPECRLKGIEHLTETELTLMLVKSLIEHTFLIVLDDVCKVDVWHKLARVFVDAANRSRVILITRDPNVARYADLWRDPLNLEPLTDDASWDLFLKKVGGSNDTESNKVEILRLCQRLPSAILLLGGLFSTIQLTEWSNVITLAQVEDQQSTLSNIVALSYHKLPYVLKPCFLYLALFPKAYEIPIRRLLHLWLAEGFVQTKESDVPEDEANKYLNELVARNMIEIAGWKSNGSPKRCRMPCYLYDEFFPKAEEIGFLHVHHCKSNCTSANSLEFGLRRLADQFGVMSTQNSHNIDHICSYVSFNTQKQDTTNRGIRMLLSTIINSSGFFNLKVLDLEGVYKPLLPDKVGVLQNLKYIGLRWTGLDSCPESIGNLPSLETLDLKYTNITTLPSPIWNTKNLRHLYMNEVSIQKPSKEPSTNLQTLMGLHIGSKDPKIYGLDRCTRLRKLGLTCNSKSAKKTAEYIRQLDHLQTLKLRSRDQFGQVMDLELSPINEHPVLSNLYLFGIIGDNRLHLPESLEVLTLSMSGLTENAMPKLAKLSKLKVLRLFTHSYVGSEMTFYAADFPELRILKLWKLEKLIQLTVQEGSMPNLLKLEIRGCKKLERSDEIPNLPARTKLIFSP